jgi:hypothetical protein
MNNKIKFLLLALGFFLLSINISNAAYVDTSKYCATFENGNFKQFNALQQNEYCIFDKSNILNWEKYSVLGLSLDEIKIPYSSAYGNYGIWEVIKNTTTNQTEWGTSSCDHGFSSHISGNAFPKISSGDINNFLKVPKTYDNVKTAIIRSCLPGKITTTVWAGLGNALCADYYCTKRWYGKSCDYHWRTMTFNPNNHPTWEFIGCGLNEEGSISLSVNTTLNPNNNRIEVGLGGSFVLNWSLSNPSASCILSGKNATNPSETFKREIKAGEVGINVRTGKIIPKTNSFPFEYVKEGIYTYTLSCAGVLNGKNSPERGVATEKITVFAGNIPPDPKINSFEFITENNEDLENISNTDIGQRIKDLDYKIPIGKTFELRWDTDNIDEREKSRSITIFKTKGAKPEAFASLNTKNNFDNPLKIDTSTFTTGIHIFTIEARNEQYPGLETGSKDIKILIGNIADLQLPEIEFSADKIEIKKGESVNLLWNVSDAIEVSIDHGIGVSQNSGSTTVYPTFTTTYTLVAKGLAGADTQKSITIKIKKSEIVIQEIKDFVPPSDLEFEEQEGAPSEEGKIDLKVNGVDGPATINSQSKFTLSWNLDKYCLATGSWLGIKLKAGSKDITLNKNGRYTYSLYCPGAGSDTVVINVVGGTNGNSRSGLIDNLLGRKDKLSEERMPIAEVSISTDQITYSQDIIVARGEPTELYIKVDQDINSDGKTSRDAKEGWSSLLSSGGYCLFNVDLARNPSEFEGMIKSPETAKECNVNLGNFTFNNEPGTYEYGIFRLLQNDKKFSNISYVNITVEGPPPPDTAPIINFKIDGNDDSEQIVGAPAEYNLTWSVANADSCEASGSWSGEKELEGIQKFVSSTKKNFNYTLTCIGELGTMVKSIALRVVEAPICSFTALPPSINKQSAFITDSELSWKCEYADWCSLEPNINEKINTYGSIRVSPNQTTTYILTCNNSSVSKSFEAKVIVE